MYIKTKGLTTQWKWSSESGLRRRTCTINCSNIQYCQKNIFIFTAAVGKLSIHDNVAIFFFNFSFCMKTAATKYQYKVPSFMGLKPKNIISANEKSKPKKIRKL